MTDLPSRKDAQRWLDSDTMIKVSDIVWPLIRGWASGRLVDREAIDYEAIHEHLLDFVLIQSLEDPGLSLNDVRQAVALGTGFVAAAIGDTDEDDFDLASDVEAPNQ